MSVETNNIIQAFGQLNPVLMLHLKKILFNTPYSVSDECFLHIFKGRLNELKKGCPQCGSSQVVKNGRNRLNIQSYRCKGCGRYHSDSTYTLSNYSKKPVLMWMQYMEGMCEGLSIRAAAQKLDISINTSFYWRHKILKALSKRLSDNLKGIVEVDNIRIAESFKGNHSNNLEFSMSRPSRQRGLSPLEKLSVRKANIICCKDRTEGILLQVTGYVSPGNKTLYEVLERKITKGSTVCATDKLSFTFLAKKNHLKLIKISSRNLSNKDIYHIENASAFGRDFEKFLFRFRGVATKYMNFYLTWFKWMDTGRYFVYAYRPLDLYTVSSIVNGRFRVCDLKTVCPITY